MMVLNFMMEFKTTSLITIIKYITEQKPNDLYRVTINKKAALTIENTNGLVRGFFPKGTDFNLVTKEKLNWVQNALNERPRETLGFNTPKDTFNSLLLNY